MQGDVAPSADISARCYPCLLFGFPKFSNNRTGPSIWEGPLCNKLPTSVAGEEYTALSSCVCLTDRLVQPAARFEELFCALVQLLQTRNLHSGIWHKLKGELHYQERWKMARFMNIYHKQPTCLPCNPHLGFYMLELLDSLFVCFEKKYFLLRVTSWSQTLCWSPWRLHSVHFHSRRLLLCDVFVLLTSFFDPSMPVSVKFSGVFKPSHSVEPGTP